MAQAQYCTIADLTSYGIRAEALRGIDADELQRVIAAMSAEIDGYLRSRYKLPLTRWGSDLSAICAKLAVYTLIMTRGFNSARAGDELIRTNYEDAISKLKSIQAQSYHPDIADSTSVTDGESGIGARPSVISCESRGYLNDRGTTGGAFSGRLR